MKDVLFDVTVMGSKGEYRFIFYTDDKPPRAFYNGVPMDALNNILRMRGYIYGAILTLIETIDAKEGS